MNGCRGWHMEAIGKLATFNDRVVPNDTAITNTAVEQDRVEANEHVVAYRTRAMHD